MESGWMCNTRSNTRNQSRGINEWPVCKTAAEWTEFRHVPADKEVMRIASMRSANESSGKSIMMYVHNMSIEDPPKARPPSTPYEYILIEKNQTQYPGCTYTDVIIPK